MCDFNIRYGCEQCEYEAQHRPHLRIHKKSIHIGITKSKHYLRSHQRDTHVEEGAFAEEKNDAFDDLLDTP